MLPPLPISRLEILEPSMAVAGTASQAPLNGFDPDEYFGGGEEARSAGTISQGVCGTNRVPNSSKHGYITTGIATRATAAPSPSGRDAAGGRSGALRVSAATRRRLRWPGSDTNHWAQSEMSTLAYH